MMGLFSDGAWSSSLSAKLIISSNAEISEVVHPQSHTSFLFSKNARKDEVMCSYDLFLIDFIVFFLTIKSKF